MRQVLKRVALTGGLTAAVLGVVGLFLAELAGLWLAAGGTAPRADAAAPPAEVAVESMTDTLKYRLPLTMAAWGFVFVAACEFTLYFWRGNRPAPVKKIITTEGPDPAEALLEELLAQADRALDARGQRAEVGGQGAGVGSQESGVGGRESGVGGQKTGITTPGRSDTLNS